MLKACISGLPISAKGILKEALDQAIGEGVYQLEDIDKNMLRTTVRLSKSNPSIVLVVLDAVATDICKDIENGLYSSDKFYTYTDDIELTKFLNTLYNLNLEIPKNDEEENSISEGERDTIADDTDRIEEYKRKLASKDFIIKNLRVQLKDMKQHLDGTFQSDINDEMLDELRDNIIKLKDDLLSAKSKISELEEENEKLKEDKSIASSKEAKNLREELATLRSNYSIQGGLLNTKDDKIKSLESRVSELHEKIERLTTDNQNLVYDKGALEKERDDLRAEISSKDRELVRYLKELALAKETQVSSSELDSLNATISSLKVEVGTLTQENTEYQKQCADKDREIAGYVERYSQLEKDLSGKDSKIEELTKRIQDDNETITKLNSDVPEMSSKLRLHDDGKDSDEIYDEYISIKKELNDIKEGVFGKVASMSLPGSAQRIRLLPPLSTIKKLNKVRFIFAGSTESRKGAYRCLYNELRNIRDKNNTFLIVDLVSETCIDYVFQIPSVVPGIDWFRKGGGIQTYLSKTDMDHVKVLTPGLRYVNDTYFLTIDWERRLLELENSGYQVFVFCGDISNLVGRIFHESFADLGLSVIYVHGNAIGARSLITNIRGISNAESSTIGYFDYNPGVKKFYDNAAKSNKCVVINVQGK